MLDEEGHYRLEKFNIINSSGKTLETRILAPKGYTRETARANSLASFIRNYPMKDDGSEVLLYNGSPKGNQNAHAASTPEYSFDKGSLNRPNY